MDLKSTLINFGFSDKEASAYLALLELEVSTAQEVAVKAHLNRSSTYVVLESLRKKGFVNVSGGELTRKYIATAPNLLVEKASELLLVQNRITENLTQIIPELNALYSGAIQKPKIRIYEGEDGILNLLREDFRMIEKVIYVCESGENMKDFFFDYMLHYAKERKRLGIKMIAITSDTPTNRKMVARESVIGDKVILVPHNKYKFPSDFAIYDTLTSLISHAGSHAIAIESKEFSDVMKTVFNLAFVGASKIGKIFRPKATP